MVTHRGCTGQEVGEGRGLWGKYSVSLRKVTLSVSLVQHVLEMEAKGGKQSLLNKS